VYDLVIGKRSVIVTNEADSEVVLDKDSVYYRVNDKLYLSALGDSGVLSGKSRPMTVFDTPTGRS